MAREYFSIGLLAMVAIVCGGCFEEVYKEVYQEKVSECRCLADYTQANDALKESSDAWMDRFDSSTQVENADDLVAGLRRMKAELESYHRDLGTIDVDECPAEFRIKANRLRDSFGETMLVFGEFIDTASEGLYEAQLQLISPGELERRITTAMNRVEQTGAELSAREDEVTAYINDSFKGGQCEEYGAMAESL